MKKIRQIAVILCVVIGGALIFYLGARFGQTFFGDGDDVSLSSASLLPSRSTTIKLDQLIAEEGELDYSYQEELEKSEAEKEEIKEMPKVKVAVKVNEAKEVKQVKKAIVEALSDEARFSLQVGSYASSKKASQLKNDLARKGYSSTIKTIVIPEKGKWYRVYIDGFDNEYEADKAGKKIQAQMGILPTVVSH